MGPHHRLCEDNPHYEANKAEDELLAKMRVLGFVPKQSKLFQCRRGCGTLVWDVEAHIKNVCTTWEPVAGD